MLYSFFEEIVNTFYITSAPNHPQTAVCLCKKHLANRNHRCLNQLQWWQEMHLIHILTSYSAWLCTNKDRSYRSWGSRLWASTHRTVRSGYWGCRDQTKLHRRHNTYTSPPWTTTWKENKTCACAFTESRDAQSCYFI